jgi:hypothetical protein
MNNNLLLIAAAGIAYAVLRPKTGTLITQTGAGTTATGAASYVPTTTPASTTNQSGWANTAGNIVAGAGTAVSIIKTGASIWDDLKDALHVKSAVPPVQASITADVTADQSAGIWAGPKLEIS